MRNLVAKHARKYNKAAVHRDRKNDYQRKPKHRNRSE
jgi:predicted nucleic acid-binding protein